ncbi:4-hydroxy-tetrahydrodipicolinate synthase [Rhizobium rhizogenes]|uniref:4-hydroxy-tetrahydrodipicolinate synthase n=1 Tax=Rhizobium rhizogenes TaxID=359 RepID=A0AAN2A7I4_RHIRH|nr:MULTISPECIES: dihydrodipicolinate synthase family protein [Rhizobium/Agrobacterium group]AQS64439.1 dihydrodipicolinate synthase family protein [Rhizobium rhizogenes]MCZ7441506.1 dihydrodipicolinate synthase family protein [Rhizobium rhizogenes]NSZ81162.1 dihydrodipicolinate synthase family protein [Agrobacterium tumefaciens]OAM62459.1 dihydrodipicolinate synthase family protein [Rhizobium rhizogenes]CAD0215519.1 4-hydroxy-tetrahydrodipicolinate synthase [Rhizobium rhizogenes]
MSKQAFVALVTCFNEDETINYEATRAQVRRQVAAGNNIMCAGTNGDFTALTHEEKIRLTEEVVDEVAGRARVIVNAGMPATFETIQLAKAFDRIGVDGIAVITPFFIACTQDGLIRHFSMVADAVETPVYLYDIPARTQNHIEPETARKLATHGNIAGIKDSGGAQQTLEAYLQVAREVPGFEVYSGPDHLVLWSLQNGAAGCISGLGNALPDVLAGILSAFNTGNTAEAERQQAIYAAFRTDLYALGFAPAMVKRSLYLQDPSVGASRQPALLPDPEQDGRILEILRRYQRL